MKHDLDLYLLHGELPLAFTLQPRRSAVLEGGKMIV